jgi:hypothetical protein
MIICKTNDTPPTLKLKYQNILNFVQTVVLLHYLNSFKKQISS